MICRCTCKCKPHAYGNGCLTLTCDPRNIHLDMAATCENDMSFTFDVRNVHLTLSAENKNALSCTAHPENVRLSVTAGLVCGVALDGKYMFLQVTEGNVITIDNNYVLVLKQ